MALSRLNVHNDFIELKHSFTPLSVVSIITMQKRDLKQYIKLCESTRYHKTPVFLELQLDLITDLLGTPNLEDMRTACEGAKTHILRTAHKPPSLAALYTLSSQASHEAVHLLCRMLVFDPVSRKE